VHGGARDAIGRGWNWTLNGRGPNRFKSGRQQGLPVGGYRDEECCFGIEKVC